MKYHDCRAKLIDWSWHPELVEDDGIDKPSPLAISHVMDWLSFLHKFPLPMPIRVVPGCDGSIVVEFETGELFTSHRFTVDSFVEVDRFENMKLLGRSRIPLPQ